MGTHVERRNYPVARPEGAPPFEIVAVASSAGGLAALTSVLSGLPRGFPAAVVLVLPMILVLTAIIVWPQIPLILPQLISPEFLK